MYDEQERLSEIAGWPAVADAADPACDFNAGAYGLEQLRILEGVAAEAACAAATSDDYVWAALLRSLCISKAGRLAGDPVFGSAEARTAARAAKLEADVAAAAKVRAEARKVSAEAALKELEVMRLRDEYEQLHCLKMARERQSLANSLERQEAELRRKRSRAWDEAARAADHNALTVSST